MSAETATRRPVSVPDEPVNESIPPLPPDPPPVPPEPIPVPPEPPAPAPAETEIQEEEEVQDPNAHVWPDGPTYGMLWQWKEQHGDESIFVTQVTDKVFVAWRTLTRFEYRRLVKNMEQAVATGQMSQAEANLNNEEQIVEICALWPKFSRQQLAGQLAGLPSIIAQEIMEASAFVSLDVKQL